MTHEQVLSSSRIGARITSAKSRTIAWFRSQIAFEAGADISLDSSATLSTQVWFGRTLYRPTAGWAAITALLALGILSQPPNVNWREVTLLLLLVDPLWGSIWRLVGGRNELLPLRERDVQGNVWLPYLQPGSPASRFLGKDDRGVVHLVYRVALPSVLLALAISFVLGRTAVWMTATVVVVCLLAWLVRHHFGVQPTSIRGLVTVALPWGLTLVQMGLTPASPHWTNHVALLGFWFLHNWGEGRVIRVNGDRLGIILIGVADVAIVALLLLSRAALWLAPFAVMWLPTWLAVYQGRDMSRLNFWWLLAMLVSGLALGQSL